MGLLEGSELQAEAGKAVLARAGPQGRAGAHPGQATRGGGSAWPQVAQASAPRPQANQGGACSWASKMDQPCLKGGWGEHTALGLADVSARKGRPPCPDGRPKAASAQHTGQTAARQPLRAPGMSTARAAVGSRKDAQARS